MIVYNVNRRQVQHHNISLVPAAVNNNGVRHAHTNNSRCILINTIMYRVNKYIYVYIYTRVDKAPKSVIFSNRFIL